MMQLIDDHLPSPKSSLNTIRSLICDRNGIIIAETVYRCLFCAAIFDSLDSIQLHYHGDHYEETPPAHFPQPPHRSLMKNSNETIIIDYDNDDYDDNVVTSENDLTDSIHGHNMVEEDVETTNSNNNSDETLDLNLGLIPLPPSTPILIKQQPSNNNNNGQQGGSGAKGGLVTCEVCGLTKFYSHISRRYGIFSCESCAKFFYRYSQKPVHYTCSHDGNCSLNSSGIRCKSCLLNACLKKYVLDPKKHSKVFKKHFNNSSSAERSIIQKNNRSSSLLKKPNHSVGLKFSANKSSYNRSKKILVCGNGGGGDHDDDGGLKFSSNKCRRMACGSCQSCSADDCGSCLYCLDKPKFGGSDVKKQKCLKRRCLHLK